MARRLPGVANASDGVADGRGKKSGQKAEHLEQIRVAAGTRVLPVRIEVIRGLRGPSFSRAVFSFLPYISRSSPAQAPQSACPGSSSPPVVAYILAATDTRTRERHRTRPGPPAGRRSRPQSAPRRQPCCAVRDLLREVLHLCINCSRAVIDVTLYEHPPVRSSGAPRSVRRRRKKKKKRPLRTEKNTAMLRACHIHSRPDGCMQNHYYFYARTYMTLL